MKVMSKLFCTSAALLLLQMAAAAQSAERRIALVIGVADYKDGGLLQSLPGIDKDVQMIIDAIKSIGFEVTGIMDPTLGEAEVAIAAFGAKLAQHSGATGLFYFSGTGFEVDGSTYLMPKGARVNTSSDVTEKGIPISKILGRMGVSKDQVNLVFLDCCRTELTSRSGSGGLSARPAPEAFISYAVGAGRVALATPTGSLYTQSLARHITQEGIPVLEMHTRIAGEVKAAAKKMGADQTPVLYSGLDRNFYLVPASDGKNAASK